MIRCCSMIVLLVSSLIAGGCVGRQAIKDLSESQDAYYARLSETLKSEKDNFIGALREQAELDAKLHNKLLTWELDQLRAEILLTADEGTGKQKLLLMKLAEIERAAREERVAIAALHEERVRTVAQLYDEVASAAGKLGENNKAITEYVTDTDSFVVKSIDVHSVVRVTLVVEQLSDQVRDVEQKTAEEIEKRRQKTQKQLEDARAAVLEALAKAT
tara:strand:+ start:3613 stop:4263 length:651 start_codon:yes stop_codon:yes gene_type:complete